MAANRATQNGQGAANKSTAPTFPSQNAPALLERAKADLRGSTPDSEALASSDDELDQLHRLPSTTSNPQPQPARRASWFADSPKAPFSKVVPTGGGPFSPTSPTNAMSATDQAPWGAEGLFGQSSSTSRGAGPALSWGSTIWNSDSPKHHSQRLGDVLPSPTSMGPLSSGLSQENWSRDPVSDSSSVPFSIPLQPTPKTYRSQSYSAGQFDPEARPHASMFAAQAQKATPRRGTSYAALKHRPSRPSMLGDSPLDNNQLEQLREVDDDDGSSQESPKTGSAWPDSSHVSGGFLVDADYSRRPVTSDQNEANRGLRPSICVPFTRGSPQSFAQRVQANFSHGSIGSPVDEHESFHTNARSPILQNFGRRFSEYTTRPGPHFALNTRQEQVLHGTQQRTPWDGPRGWSPIPELSHSRRHSLAEIPTRRNSFDSNEDEELVNRSVSSTNQSQSSVIRGSPRNRLGLHDFASQSPPEGNASGRSNSISYGLKDSPSRSKARPYTALASVPSFSSGQYGYLAERSAPCLFIVTFKCLRADVFYVQEGTGLRIEKGNLVIVEADRGTDLGTIATDPVSWPLAKQLKEEYTRKHHEWLMAFSHHTQNGSVAGANPNGPPQSSKSSQTSQTSFQDIPCGEIKPKMIKRLAQPHEISTLREKEGAEAKAKRLCQQKVVDHRLNMEILDAEYQVDWKKLTFFYFADSYINFNALVTDLFKIYKTRIWMSAINTAAIAAPHASKLQASGMRPTPQHLYGDHQNAPYIQSDMSSRGPSEPPYEPMYSSGRNQTMLGGMPIYQEYSQPTYVPRQFSPFSTEYRPVQQQHMPTFTTNQEASSNAFVQGFPNQQADQMDWPKSFEQLAL